MWQGEPAYVKTASALQLRKSLLPHSPSVTLRATPPSRSEADKAAATEASPFGRGGGVADGEGKRQRTSSPQQPACHLERSRNPSETRARSEGFAPRISRDEDASKVVRPRFRMGLKPTALLRHTAKVRLTCGSLRMTRDGMLRGVPLLFNPLSHGKPCQLSHKESLRSRSPCYSRWQRQCSESCGYGSLPVLPHSRSVSQS